MRRPFTLVIGALSAAMACRSEPDEPIVVSDAGSDGEAPFVPSDGADDHAPKDVALPNPCVAAGEYPVEIAYAPKGGDFVLEFVATSSATRWSMVGNEAVVLELTVGASPATHVLLHQGEDAFRYSTVLTASSAGEAIKARVSDRSAAGDPDKRVCFTEVKATPSSSLGALSEGVEHAPIFFWPVTKRFDDVPLLLGFSKAQKAYTAVMTHENGGTVQQCGGGADGVRAEIARWGRAFDVESVFDFGPSPSFRRCTGEVALAPGMPRMEGLHPLVYYGSGHNGFFEDRSGYGVDCGSGAPEKADGNIAGWGGDAKNATDEAVAMRFRPVPLDLDALGFASFFGRREGLPDTYAPWLYRITSEELAREGRIDGVATFDMNRYLYADVHVSDVGGSGSEFCGSSPSSGFKLRVSTKSGIVASSAQMTASFAGGTGEVWKRLAVPLPVGVAAKDVTSLTFDAYDGDGIYFLELGDVFIASAKGGNGASIDVVVKGKKAVSVYVDDDSSGCTGGMSAGPKGPVPCVGGTYALPVP